MLAFAPNNDIQDTKIGDALILDNNAFERIELMPSETANDAFEFLIALKDKNAKDWYDFIKNNKQKNIAFVIDDKLVIFKSLGMFLIN